VCIFPLMLFEQTFYQVRPYDTEICHPLCARGLGILQRVGSPLWWGGFRLVIGRGFRDV